MQTNTTQERSDPTAIEHYQHRVQALESQIHERMTLSRSLTWARIGLAVPGLVLIVYGLMEKTAPSWLWKLGLILFVGFLAAATWHETNLWNLSVLRQRLQGYRRLLARCERQWSSLPPLATESVCSDYISELSRDLDLFGERSLYRWSSLAMTRSGANKICEWLTRWSDHETIRERQQAVQSLSKNRGWRETFFETTCMFQSEQAVPEGIVDWCQQEDYFAKKQWVHWLTWLSPAVIVAGVACILVAKAQEHELGQAIGLGMALAGAAVNFLLTMLIIGPIHDIFNRIGTANRELQSLSDILHAIHSLDTNTSLLASIRQLCFASHHSATQALRQLQSIMQMAGMQRNPLLFIPYLLLQILFLWDVRVLELLERWKHTHGPYTAGWLQAIGSVEALCSAAFIADEYPSWSYPRLNPKDTTSNAPLLCEIRAIAHPLLKDTSRVSNDVAIERSKPLLLVTGSNMAGKSTLLRSMGINSILSRLGAPVCAASWEGAACELASSIRVQDSLQDGVSFFMAELKRLRSVVDLAQRENQAGGKQMMILLDEILQGTNSRERQIAVEHVLNKLVEYGCIVVTSTHDLEMAGNEQIQRIAQVVHFREHFENIDGAEVMRFDYVMHPGATPTTNALKLLQMVGLGTAS